MTEVMPYIQVECVVMQIAIIYIGLNHAIERLRIGSGHSVARLSALTVPVDPVGPGTVCSLGRSSLSLRSTNEWRGTVDVQWAVNAQRMSTNVVHTERPARRELMLQTYCPLFRIWVEQFVGIA